MGEETKRGEKEGSQRKRGREGKEGRLRAWERGREREKGRKGGREGKGGRGRKGKRKEGKGREGGREGHRLQLSESKFPLLSLPHPSSGLLTHPPPLNILTFIRKSTSPAWLSAPQPSCSHAPAGAQPHWSPYSSRTSLCSQGLLHLWNLPILRSPKALRV